MSFLDDHFARLRTAVNETYDLSQVPRWITDHTKLRGLPYSFKDHEFQEKIISDTSQIVNIAKISQVGLSEVISRWALGVSEIFPGFGVIVTFPFSGDAENFCRTRVDPIIAGSERLKAAINPKLNNASVKQIHESLLYFRGTNGKTQAISTPADVIVSDEIDRSDPDILKMFESRLTHSAYKLRRNFSTPTVPGWGIDLEMQTSRRHRNLCKCDGCNNWFLPDYFDHIKIPGYTGSLRELNKSNIHRTRYMEAALICPHCGKAPSLKPEHRNWVQENTNDNFSAAGYYVTPFDAPGFITPSSLVYSSTQYGKYSEFLNQGLGLTSEEEGESLNLADLNASKTTTDLASGSIHSMGIDVGLICHITVGRLTAEGHLLVVHREEVTVSQLEERKDFLKKKYRVIMTVIDGLPYTDLVIRLQRKDKNLFGASYNVSKNSPIYEIKMFEGDEKDGKLPINIAKIRNNEGFDQLLGMFKAREIKIYIQDEYVDETFDKHVLDLKRILLADEHMELSYRWMKSKSAVDHYFHSLLYLLAACRLRGAATSGNPIFSGSPIRTVRAIQRQVDWRGVEQNDSGAVRTVY